MMASGDAATADPLTLRRAEPADAQRLALLGSATFLAAFAHDHPGDAIVDHCAIEHSVERYATWIADPAYAVWIAETALEAPIGYAVLSPPQLDLAVPADALELKRIYTLAGWQGTGLGPRLIETVIAEARQRGAKDLYLCVYESNARARAFYARHGFTKVGEQYFPVGDTPFTDWVLHRRLD